MRQIVEKAQWLTTDFIDGKAEALLCDYEQVRGQISAPPVPARKIVEVHLGLAIDWCIIPEAQDEKILACLDPEAREIRFNETRRSFFDTFFGSETFTLGHETGHWVLHVQDADAVQLSLFNVAPREAFICRAQGQDSNDSLEWQAQRFAAALVMPEAMVREYAEQVNLYRWPTLYRMKDAFDVTISALKNRLVELGLLYVAPDKGLWRSYKEFRGQSKLY